MKVANASLADGIALATILLQLFVGSVWGADGDGNYAIWGLGRDSCHRFVQSTESDARKHYEMFVMGYLTAFNTLREDTYSATGERTLQVSLDWLREYCANNQMESFDRAIQQLLTATYDSRDQIPPGKQHRWGRATLKSSATPKPAH